MSAALYLLTVFGLLWAANRWISPIRRLTAVLLVVLPLLFTGRALWIDGLFGPFDLPYETAPLRYQSGAHGFGGAYNGMISDLYTQIIPYRKAVRDAVRRGEWPLWNRYTLSGEPLAAEAQPAAYSPFTLLALLLPVAKSFTYSATLWFFIAAFGAFLFMRELGCGDLPSLVAGMAFMASSGLVFFILWPLAECWALLPLVFVGVRRLDRAPWLLVIALTLVVLTGHPESVVHIVFLGAAYGVMHFSRRAALHAMVAGALTLGLCAMYLLPFIEASKQTEDYTGRQRMYANAKRSVGAERSLLILATDLLSETQQRVWRTSQSAEIRSYTAAVGSIALALFVYAMWRVRGREKWFFAGMLLFCLLEHVRSPLEDVMQRLPLFDIAINDRFVFGAAFAFAVLAALGVNHLANEGAAGVRRFVYCGAGTIAFIVIASAAVNPLLWPNREQWGDYRAFADVALLAIALLIVIARPRAALPALFICLLVQRTIQEHGVYPTFRADVAYPRIPLFAALKNVHEPFRIVGEGITFLPGTNAFYGLEDVRGYSPMTFRRYGVTYDLWCRRQPVFVNLVTDLQRPFLSLMNVRYAMRFTFLPAVPHWHEVARDHGLALLENEDVIPRAFVPSVVHLGSVAPLMELSLAADLGHDAWIDAPVAPAAQANGAGHVSIHRIRNGYAIAAAMKNDAWVVVSEPAWPGWRAYVDGHRVQHHFADIAFIGIRVPAGTHAVRLVYWPESFVIGRVISFGTLAAIIVFVIARRRAASRDRDRRSGRS